MCHALQSSRIHFTHRDFPKHDSSSTRTRTRSLVCIIFARHDGSVSASTGRPTSCYLILFFPIISRPPYCPVIAPSSPLSSDSPIRRRLSGAGSAPRAPWLALLRQLPILHMETWPVSVALCKVPSHNFGLCLARCRVDVHGLGWYGWTVCHGGEV
jgi:hypothetical protein